MSFRASLWSQFARRVGLGGLALASTLFSRGAQAEPLPTAADDTKGKRSGDLAEQVLDLQGLSQLSLERLLDLPVVTASGKAEERSLAAANVFIITRDEIERRGYRALGEMLKHVPGLYLTYDYVNYGVGVREVTGGYRSGTRLIKIMVDGFPVSFRPDLEAFLGPEFIPVEAIERVEVAKGPLSALYGANAFLATVNVITREPDDRAAEVTGRYWVVNGNPGAGASAVARYAGIDASLLLSASVDQIDRSGVQARQTYPRQQLNHPALQRPTADDQALPKSVFGRLDYHHDTLGSFRLEVGHQALDNKEEFQLNSVVTHRSRVSLVNQWAVLAWQLKRGALSARSYVGYSRGAPTDEYQLFLSPAPFGTTGNNNLSSSYQPQFGYRSGNALAEISYDFGAPLQADVGVDAEYSHEKVLFYRETTYQSTRRRPFEETDILLAGSPRSHEYRQVGTYVQLRSAPIPALPQLRLTAAARGDFIRFGPISYPVQPSVRGALAYRFDPRFTVRLIGGRAFQAPSGTLLFAHPGFGNDVNVAGVARVTDPASLRQQVVNSVEAVGSAQLGDHVSLEGAAFYQDLHDAIRFNQTPFIVAKNGGRVSTIGAELMARLQWRWLRPYAALSTSRQVSAQSTRDSQAIATFSGSPAMYPRLFGYLGCDFELMPSLLFANVELWWATRRGASQSHYFQNDLKVYSLPSYRTLEATLSTGDLPVLSRELKTRFLFSVRNLLGEDYLEPGFAGVDIPQPSTSILAQLRQEL